ncbi:MAG: branched-chain amino acid ABC transporter permease [Chloroflexota bacterium]
MNVRLLDRFTDLAIALFLWAFRAAVILVVVLGSALTLLSGTYTFGDWFELIGRGLTLGSIYAMIALGYTMVYGILRMINFAHGEIFMGGAFGGYFAAVTLAQAGALSDNVISGLIAIIIMILVAMAVSVGLAMGVERVAYRPLRGAPRLVPLISAIGASLFLQYTFRGFFGSGLYAYPNVPFLNQAAPIPLLNLRWVDVLVVVAAFCMMGGLYLFVMRSKVGTAIRAVSEDRGTAALMGIDANRAIVLTFVIGAAMAGAAGVLYGLRFTQVTFFMGFMPGIKAFTAAVLGGIGSVPGAMLGGLFLGLIEAVGPTLFLTGFGVPSTNQLKDVVAFTMLVLVLVFRPSGIMGERGARGRA